MNHENIKCYQDKNGILWACDLEDADELESYIREVILSDIVEISVDEYVNKRDAQIKSASLTINKPVMYHNIGTIK